MARALVKKSKEEYKKEKINKRSKKKKGSIKENVPNPVT
jgi:hypothetical protein